MFLSKGYRGIYDLYFTHPLSGKRTKITTGTSNFKTAKRFQERFSLEEHLCPITAETPHITNLNELKGVILEYVKTNFTQKTLEIYEFTFKVLLRLIGNKSLNSLKYHDFELFKTKRIQEVSRTTVNMQIRTIKSIFNLTQKFGYLENNPVKGLTQFSIPEKEILSFSDIDLLQLMNAIDNPFLKEIVIFTLYTGCRLAEVLNIQWKDVDIDNCIINIRNKSNFKTKTGKIRMIPICDKLAIVLTEKYQTLYSESYLFSNSNNQRFNPTHISHLFKKYLRKSGLPEKYHFHCLRHTFVTNLIKNGVPINFVKELAGHSNIQTTMGYVHIEVENLRSAVNNIKLAM